MKASDLLAIAAVAGIGYLLYKGATSGLTAASTYLNPASPQNLVYTGASNVVSTVTGSPGQTVGGAIFDWLNPNAGLAPNETSPAPGVIVNTGASQSGTDMTGVTGTW